MVLTRRSILGAAAGLPLVDWRGAAAAAIELKQAAMRAGLLFGSDSDVELDRAPEGYVALVAQHCDLFAPQLSWGSVARQRADLEPAWEDPNIAWARRHNMRLTGGHLLWHENSPRWFTGLDEGPPAQMAVDRHIDRLTRHYAGQVFSWNVVNEAIDPGRGDADGLRRSAYPQTLGPDWIAHAFHTARAADPACLLAYNDNGLEMDTKRDAARRDTLLRLLDRLQPTAPIDAVGLQSHLRLDDTTFNQTLYDGFLRDLAGRGLKLLITELDVLDVRGPADFASRDADVAARYRAFLDVALAQPAVKSLVVWGLSDRYTWLTADRDAYFSRPDRLPTRPLPFDAAFQPKPAFYAIMDALRSAPQRTPA